MITKKDLIAYKKQNPSKYAHKFGHIDLDSLSDEGYINVQKATTKLDGTPASPTVPFDHPSNKNVPSVEIEKPTVVEDKKDDIQGTDGGVTTKVNGGELEVINKE